MEEAIEKIELAEEREKGINTFFQKIKLPQVKLPFALPQFKFCQGKLDRKKGLTIGAVVLAVVLVLGLIIGLPLLSTYRKAMKIKAEAVELKTAVINKDLALAKVKLEQVRGSLVDTRSSYGKMAWLKIVPGLRNYYLDGERFLLAGEQAMEAGQIVITAAEPYQDFLGLGSREEGGGEKTTEDRVEFLTESIASLNPQLTALEEKLAKIEELLEPVKPGRYPKKVKGFALRENLVKGKKELNQLVLFFHQGKPLLEKADWLLGKDEPRKYLLLFQNDGEIRPTGGFWTAYGVLAVDNGEITPLISEDIYALDNRFDSTIEAPEPIQLYLNEKYWYLRNMNISPDFRLSLETFWPYYQEVGREKEIDGVIALDTNVLVSLLDQLGQIGVPGWGNFSAEPDERCWGCPNVVYQLEELADLPGSSHRTERKGFLAPIMHSILSNAMGSPMEKVSPLVTAMFNDLKAKHMLVYFFDPELQGAVEKLGFAGRILDAEEDYFHLNDCNFGGAKSNLFITQEVKHEYQVEGDKIKKKVSVKSENSAPASNCNLEKGGLCLNGLYRDWFRFYLPEGSQLEKMVGTEPEAKVYQEQGKTVFEGFYGEKFPLYPKGIGKVTIEYILPFSSQKQLELLIQKQPGKDPVKHEIWVNGQKQEEIMVDGDTRVTVNL